MAAGNGHDPKPVDTLFGAESFDAGIINGLGHVIVREARLVDVWPYMGTATGASEFGMRLLAAAIEINGRRFSFEEFGRISVRHLRQLQALFPEVRRINGMDDETEEETPKNVEGGAAAPEAQGSAVATGS